MFHNCWLCSIFVDHVPHWNVLELQSCFGHAQMVVYDMCASRNQRSQIKWANISEFFVLIVMRDRVQRGFDARVLLFPNVLSDHSKAWSFHHHQLPAIDASLKKLGIHQNLSPCEHEHLRYIFYIYIHIIYIYHQIFFLLHPFLPRWPAAGAAGLEAGAELGWRARNAEQNAGGHGTSQGGVKPQLLRFI